MKSIRRFINGMSDHEEVILVLVVIFGKYIYTSHQNFISNYIIGSNNEPIIYTYSNAIFINILFYQVLFMILIFSFLKMRDWNVFDLFKGWSFRQVISGIIVFLIYYGIFYLWYILSNKINIIGHEDLPKLEVLESTSFTLSLITMAIVNVLYEEIFLLGYLGSRLKKIGLTGFFIISLLIRISYHTYQGSAGMLMIAIFGGICTIFYIKYEKIMPILIAHSLLNILAMYRVFFD